MMSSFRPDAEPRDRAFVAESSAAWTGGSDSPLLFAPQAHGASDETASAERDAAEERSGPTPEEIATLEQAAFDRGVASARLENDRIEAASRALEAAAAAWQRVSATRLSENREGLLRLAARIARQWVGAELSLSPDLFAGSLERMARELDGEGQVVCRLAPVDRERLEANAAERVSAWAADGVIRLEDDEALASGDQRLEVDGAGIDARLDVILADLEAGLMDALAGSDSTADPADESVGDGPSEAIE